MSLRSICGLALLCCVSPAWAQQSVQLPTLSVFTVDTTVSVPDRGGIFSGGVGRAFGGTSSRGGLLPGRRSLGSSRSAGGLQVRARVIDLGELDRLVLAAAENEVSGAPPLDPLSRRLQLAAHEEPAQPGNSVAAIRRRQAVEAAVENEAGVINWERGLAAEQAGKPQIARIYYRLAARQLTGDERKRVIARLNRLAEADVRGADTKEAPEVPPH
jgi:hypothetical protein